MSDKKKILISTRKGLIVYAKNARNKWQMDEVHFLGFPVTMAHVDQHNNTWWAGLDHGHWGCKLHKSVNEGKNWKEVSAPKYPEGAEVRDGVAASLNYIWAINTIHASDESQLLIGTVPGGLFTSNDVGESFQLNKGLWDHPTRKEQWFGGGMDHPGIHSIIIDPNDNHHFYIAISCAGVFETSDGGTSWNAVNKGLKADFLPNPNAEVGQDPHLLVGCLSNPKVLWQQNHCGIFRTSDGAQSWTDISSRTGEANFGFAIAADDTNDQLAWVVPAISDETRVAINNSLCVCRTENGGRSWETFSKGLPQGNAFDITYRHALAQDQNNLAFGTTTGNLYFSQNYGESWTTLNNNLPMVHCVEFI